MDSAPDQTYLWAAEMCNNDENEVLGLLYSGKFLGAEIMYEYNVRMGNYLNEQNDIMSSFHYSTLLHLKLYL